MRREGEKRVSVVFLHGIAGSGRIWTPQLSSFRAHGYDPIALDLPGYGARPPVEEFDFAELAADLEAAITERGLDRPVLVGHSFGGMIAQTALRRRPDSYRALILSGTSAAFGSPGGDFQQKFVAARLGPLDAGRTMAELAPGMAAGLIGPDADPAGRALAEEVFAATPAQSFRAAVRCLVHFDERENLPHIRVPVLCLVGEHDRNAPPKVAQGMAARVPGARFVCLAGLGHLPNLERPAAFDAAVFAFLDEVLGNESRVPTESLSHGR